MTLRSSLKPALFAVLWMAGAGLILTGCDSNGGGSGEPDPSTFEVTVENVGGAAPILKSGAFTPADVINDNNNVPPLEPGEAFEFSFTAGPNEIPGSGMRLSFASMFVQSNDVYYAFEPGGLSLFDDNGTPIGMSGPTDVTSSVQLYDAGTEVDEQPGTGENQAPGNGPDVGPDEDGTIVRIEENDNGVLEDDGYTYPAVADGMKMTVSSQEHEDGGYQFTVTIENVGSGDQVNGAPLVLSPGSYAVHWAQTPSGDPVTYPGHSPGEEASDGIERIAEDGKPDELRSMLASSDGVSSAGTFGEAPLPPGQSASFSIDARPGDRLSFATMYVQSNDLFYAFQPSGMALFNENDDPVSGDVTGQIMLYDAGTEGDQEPGVGLDQAPRQSDVNTGPGGEGSITQVNGSNDGFSYPPTVDGDGNPTIIKVTVTPQ